MAITRRSLVRGAAILAGGAALFGVGAAGASYRETVGAARRSIARRGVLAPTRHGLLEYAVAGRGPPFMMIHGTGGGFDQGLTFGAGLTRAGFSVVAPSRFGYLGSAWPDNLDPAMQADAFADLLDHLGIDRLPVAGGSAGSIPAAYFALRHPDRCSHLVLLVPAMNLTGRDPVEFTAVQKALVGRLLTSDAWFWAVLRLAPDVVMGTLLATDPALLVGAPDAERMRAETIMNELMPISLRSRGMAYDGVVAGRPERLDVSAIEVPMLVISAEDDRFGTAETARLIGGRVPKARVVIYLTGGHIWLGHDEDVTGEMARFAAGNP